MTVAGAAGMCPAHPHRELQFWNVAAQEFLCSRCLFRRSDSGEYVHDLDDLRLVDDTVGAEAQEISQQLPQRLGELLRRASSASTLALTALHECDEPGSAGMQQFWAALAARSRALMAVTHEFLESSGNRDAASALLTCLRDPELLAMRCNEHGGRSYGFEFWDAAEQRRLCSRCLVKHPRKDECALVEEAAPREAQQLFDLLMVTDHLLRTRGAAFKTMLTASRRAGDATGASAASLRLVERAGAAVSDLVAFVQASFGRVEPPVRADAAGRNCAAEESQAALGGGSGGVSGARHAADSVVSDVERTSSRDVEAVQEPRGGGGGAGPSAIVRQLAQLAPSLTVTGSQPPGQAAVGVPLPRSRRN